MSKDYGESVFLVILRTAKNLTQSLVLNPFGVLRLNSVKDLMSSFALLRMCFVAKAPQNDHSWSFSTAYWVA
jgi:hypothetical protein